MSAVVLANAVNRAAEGFSSRTCLTQGERSWTFAAFHAEVDALAAGFAARWPAGARVGLFMANRAEYLILQCALEQAGLVRVPMNARFTEHEFKTIVDDCEPVAVLHDQVTAARLALPTGSVGPVCHAVDDAAVWQALKAPGQPLPDAPPEDALCSINYTSGTSGRPKGVMLTHRNWSALTRNMLIDRDLRGTDVVAHIGPLTHASGTYFVPWFLRGARQVIVDGGTVDDLLKAITRERVSVFTCVPTLLTRIVNHPDRDSFDLSSLRAIFYGAEPIPKNTLEKALTRFGPILTQNYGLTEAMMTVATLQPEDHVVSTSADFPTRTRHGCIGRPYTFVDVVLRDAEGRSVKAGEVGEITIRSEHATGGYWNRPQETERLLRNGWLWTGDLARADDEGYIYLSGRNKDMLISGGFNIYPAELEAVLTGHPAVIECGVVGVPHEGWGEVPIAFIVRVPEVHVGGEELDAYCKPLLGFRRPSEYRFLDALPKNANGKIDKAQLKVLALADTSTINE